MTLNCEAGRAAPAAGSHKSEENLIFPNGDILVRAHNVVDNTQENILDVKTGEVVGGFRMSDNS